MIHQADNQTRGKTEIGVLYGFRALMVLFVCNYHIWQIGWLEQYATLFGQTLDFDFWTRSGYLFVDGMLLLSGFLLYLPYARQTAERFNKSVVTFHTLNRFYNLSFKNIQNLFCGGTYRRGRCRYRLFYGGGFGQNIGGIIARYKRLFRADG